MMNFKHNKHGFSLIEVLASLAIIAIVLTVLLSSLSQTITTVATRSDRLTLLLQAKQFLVEAAAGIHESKEGKPIEKKIEDPPVTSSYVVEPLPKKSKLSKIPSLKIARVTTQTTGGIRPLKDSIAAILFQPEQKQKDQKESK